MLYKINNIHSTHTHTPITEPFEVLYGITNEISIECNLVTINSGKKRWGVDKFPSFRYLDNTAFKQRTITSILYVSFSVLCRKFYTAEECSIHLGSKKKLFWPRYDSVRIWIKVGHKNLPPFIRLKRWICVHTNTWWRGKKKKMNT